MRSLTLNGTVESWPRCLACALTDRSFAYTSENRTAECQSCFNTWCWNGQDDDSEPATYEPIVGSIPEFLTANNLASGASDAPAPSQTSQAAAESGSPSSSPNSGLKVELVGGWSVGVAIAGILGGAMSIML